MKAIVSADFHIDINNRFEDTKSVLRQMATYAIMNKVDQFWILGDIYDKKRPCSSEIVLFHQFVKSLTDSNIAVEMISGNHDIDKHQVSSLQELAVWDLPNVVLHANPFVINFDEHRVYLGHHLVIGAKLGALDYSSRHEIPLAKILETPANLYLLGDVHKAQKLHSNPDVLYVGSPERVDFGERDEVKGFTLLNSVNGDLKYKFILLETRRMIQYDYTFNENGFTELGCNSFPDAIVKLKINCTKEKYKEINEKEIRLRLSKAYSLKIEYNIIREDRTRNSDISESVNPADAFLNYAKEKEFDKQTINAGLEIIQELK